MSGRGTTRKFAVCIQSDDADLLTPRMIYWVMPDESAAQPMLSVNDEGIIARFRRKTDSGRFPIRLDLNVNCGA